MEVFDSIIFQLVNIDKDLAESKFLYDNEYDPLFNSILRPLEDVFYQLKSRGYTPYIHGFTPYDLVYQQEDHLRNEFIVYIEGPNKDLFGSFFDIKKELSLTDNELFRIRLLKSGNGVYSLIHSLRSCFKSKVIFIYGDINRHLEISYDKKYSSILMDSSELIKRKISNMVPTQTLNHILNINNYWMFKDFIKYLMKYEIDLVWEVILSDDNKKRISDFLRKLPSDKKKDFVKYVVIHLNSNHKKLFNFILNEFLLKYIKFELYARSYNKLIKSMKNLYNDYPRRLALIYYYVLINMYSKNNIKNRSQLLIFDLSNNIIHPREMRKMLKYFNLLIER